MDNLIIEIKRNLELMGVSEKPIILEQKQMADEIADLIINASRAAKNDGKKAKDIINFGGIKTDLEQLDGLLNSMKKFNRLEPSRQIETLSLLDKIFPDKVTKSFFDEFVTGGEEDLLYAVSQNSPKIKTVEELKNWLEIGADFDEKDANMAANILGDKFLKRADDYGRHLEELETNPKAEFDGFTTDEAKAKQSERINKASDTGRAGDDVIDTPNASRTDVDGEREIVGPEEINPKNPAKTIDGEDILYDAYGRPTVPKRIKPKETEEIPNNTPDPELKIDNYSKLSEVTEALRNSGNKFVKNNKKEFDELENLLKKYEDKNLTLSEKQQIKREVEKLSKNLTSRWKRTFIGKKEIKKFIEELKSIEGELSPRDRTIVNQFKSIFEDGIEDYLNSVSGLKKLLMMIRGVFKGLGDSWSDKQTLYKSIKNLFKSFGLKKESEFNAELLYDSIEGIFATPKVVTKWKRLQKRLENVKPEDGKSQEAYVTFVSSLIYGFIGKSVAVAIPLAAIKAIVGRLVSGQIQAKLDKLKSGEELTEEERYELIQYLSYIIQADYDRYLKQYGESIADPDVLNIANNFFDELDPDTNWGYIPSINRFNAFSEGYNFIMSLEYFGSGDSSGPKNKIDEWINKIATDIVNNTFDANDIIGEIDKDKNSIFSSDIIMNEFEIVEDYIRQFAEHNVDLIPTSWSEFNNNLKADLKTIYKRETPENLHRKEFFDNYVSLENGNFKLKTKSGKDLTFVKKALDGKPPRWYFSINGGDGVYTFDNPAFNKSKLKPISEWSTTQNESIIGLISVLLEEVDDEFGPSEQERIEQERSEREGSSNGTSENDGSSTSSESEDNNESELDSVLRAVRSGDKIKSKGGNFTYLKDSSDKIKSNIKDILNGARNDARRPHRDAIHVTLTNPSDYNSQKVVLAGTSEVDGSEVQYDIEKDPSGVEWGWIDNTGNEEGRRVWKSFSEYKNRQ